MLKKPVTQKSKLPRAEVPFPTHSRELPATQGMLKLVRDELRAEMKAGFHRIESRFNEQESKFSTIDSRFNQIDSRFNQIDSRFSQIDARFEKIDARFEQVLSEIARLGVLIEEQNSRNKIVLEGLTGLWQRQEQFDLRLTSEVERCVATTLARSRT